MFIKSNYYKEHRYSEIKNSAKISLTLTPFKVFFCFYIHYNGKPTVRISTHIDSPSLSRLLLQLSNIG